MPTEGDALGAGVVLKSRPTGILGLLGFQYSLSLTKQEKAIALLDRVAGVFGYPQVPVWACGSGRAERYRSS